MKFDGQHSLKIDKKGSLLIDLHNDDMKIIIPETYQVINGVKKLMFLGSTITGIDLDCDSLQILLIRTGVSNPLL